MAQIQVTEAAAPAAPSASIVQLYAYTDGNLYIQTSAAGPYQLVTTNSGVAVSATNLTGTTVGSLPYQSAAGVTSYLADVAVGSVLISGGVGAAPSYSALSGITAGNSTNTLVTTSTTNSAYPLMLSAVTSTGQQSSLIATALTYNPSTAVLTASNISVSAGSTLTTGVTLGAAAADTVGFYGTTPVAQRATTSIQHTSLLATMTTTTGSLLDGANLSTINQMVVALQEVMNTLAAYGLWGTH
ncbi:MAG: hypothetical protein ACLQKH_15165 [Steroidobacteraceae bacterium]